jgi:gluconokinase
MVVILMGVSGSGKTTVGLALAESLQWQFVDADDYHPPENVAKMRAGIPLNDADRAPWLAILRDLISGWLSSKTNVVLACSALKQTYREELNTGPEVRFIYLRGDKELIAERLSARPGHYMDPHLLDSQFASLEEPHDVVVVDVRSPVAKSVAQIRRELGLESQP